MFRTAPITIASLAAGALVGCTPPLVDRPVEHGAELLPADCDAIVSIESLATLHANLDVDSLRTHHQGVMTPLTSGFADQLGFDPSDLAAARTAGLDVDAPIVVGFLAEPKGATALVLPGDVDALREATSARLARRGATLTEGDAFRDVAFHDADRAQTSTLSYAGHLVVVSGVSRRDTRLELCKRLVEDTPDASAGTSRAFADTRGALSGSPDVLLFVPGNPEGGRSIPFLDALPPSIDGLLPLVTGPLARHEGALVALTMSPTGITIDGRTRLATDDPFRSIAATARHSRPITADVSGAPFVVLVANADGAALRDWLTGGSESVSNGSAGAGVGPRMRSAFEGFLGEVDGRAGVVVNNLGFTGTDVVLFAEVAEPEAFQQRFDAFITSLREEPISLPLLGSTAGIDDLQIEGVDCHTFGMPPFIEICAGAYDDRALLTTTSDRFASIVRGGSSFTARMSDADVRRAIESGALLAVSARLGAIVGPLSSVFEGMPMMDALESASDVVDEIAITARIAEFGYEGHVRLDSDQPGIWGRMIETFVAMRGTQS